eukprot:TRINITY_DN13484_c0_g1_i4.p1 TRINITY_DN13484_c0_g1~~TRINITY_DN13484_c0_g1_i4.p1  ORF type:complete len:214 (+),score=70.35 TRINITY_DN13484_c0_g1_i4:91-642(+)
MLRSLVGSEMCIRDRFESQEMEDQNPNRKRRKLKRLKTGYELYLADFKKKWRKDRPGVPFDEGECRKQGRDEWDRLPAEGQEPYAQQAQEISSKILAERAQMRAKQRIAFQAEELNVLDMNAPDPDHIFLTGSLDQEQASDQPVNSIWANAPELLHSAPPLILINDQDLAKFNQTLVEVPGSA